MSEPIIKKHKEFWTWLSEKFTDKSYFTKLALQEKRKVFLLWKHGACDQSNEEFELTEKQICKVMENNTLEMWNQMKESDRKYFQNKLAWMDHCEQVWKKIEAEDGEYENFKSIRKHI